MLLGCYKCKKLSPLFFYNVINLDIADVTNFVHLGTPLDDEATQRGTSVYLVERRIDMLPKPLTEGAYPPPPSFFFSLPGHILSDAGMHDC